MLTIRKATRSDVDFIVPRLRKADRDEIAATGSPDPHVAIMAGLAGDAVALTAVDQRGEPVTMFGVCQHPHEPTTGVVWALATNQLRKHRKSFLKPSLEWVEALNRRFPLITNFTDCRNAEHHRWLKWCGFTFINKVRGPLGHPFYEVVRLRTHNV